MNPTERNPFPMSRTRYLARVAVVIGTAALVIATAFLVAALVCVSAARATTLDPCPNGATAVTIPCDPPTTRPSTSTTTLPPGHVCVSVTGVTYHYNGPVPPCGRVSTTTIVATAIAMTPPSAPPTVPTLPSTGTDNGPAAMLAVEFIIAGGLLIWKGRRRDDGVTS